MGGIILVLHQQKVKRLGDELRILYSVSRGGQVEVSLPTLDVGNKPPPRLHEVDTELDRIDPRQSELDVGFTSDCFADGAERPIPFASPGILENARATITSRKYDTMPEYRYPFLTMSLSPA